MKKKVLVFSAIFTLICICFLSCNGGDDNNHDNGSENTSDVAVTGNVSKLGVTYAVIDGYVNLNHVTASYNSQQIGIELSMYEDFKSPKISKTNELVGNKISILIDNLNGNTKYYYRTVVRINSLFYYGEKRSFSTKEFSNIVSISEPYDITERSFKIKCEIDVSKIDRSNTFHIGLAYSTTKTALHPDSIDEKLRNGYLKVYNLDKYFSSNESKTFENEILDLKSGTLYYYCSYTLAGSKYMTSEIRSLTTQGKSSWDDYDNDFTVKLTPPPYKDVAKTLNITQNNAEGIKQLRMMESGAYMIAREAAASARATRGGEGDWLYEFGKFTYSDGKFKFDNGMIISYEAKGSGYEITITWKNGTTIKTTGAIDTSSSVTAGVMTDNLCSRPWKIERVIASGVFGGATLGKEFKGPIDLAEVKKWYEDNYGTLKDQFDANTIIEGIYFDSKGLFAINYKNRKDDVGVWRWTSMNDGKLVYNWNDKLNAISLFTGNASVTFEKNPESCKLTLAGMVNNVDMQFVFYLK